MPNRKTPLKRTTALVASPLKRSMVHAAQAREPKLRPRRRDTSPTARVVALVWQRDEGCCFRCGVPIRFADRGVGWSLQHRRARGMGGSRRSDTNRPQSLIVLCGSATTGCHGYVESHPIASLGYGWAVSQQHDPLRIAVVHWGHGPVWLTEDGAVLTSHPDA